MSLKNRSQSCESGKKVESRYMINDKKRYLLASVDEDQETLKKKQKEELTNVLIGLKSEYDKLSRETKIKIQKINELNKKSKILKDMDSKNQRKFKNINENNELMKHAVEKKKKKKEEEIYLKKTFEKKIENLKSDIFLIQKDIIQEEAEGKQYENEYHKLRIQENDIKAKKNNKYNQIVSQKFKNIFEQNENNLQLKYYSRIINQKNEFLKSADERKEKQVLISKAAKNDSQDKIEIKMRKAYQLTMLYNQYLREKMKIDLEKFENIENAFREIREISVNYFIKYREHQILMILSILF